MKDKVEVTLAEADKLLTELSEIAIPLKYANMFNVIQQFFATKFADSPVMDQERPKIANNMASNKNSPSKSLS